MIDDDITFAEKGYRSTDLSHGSGKPVWAVCEGENCEREGGRGRWVMFKAYTVMCHSCAIKNLHIRKEGYHTCKRNYIDDEITYAEKGYKSTWLKPNSHNKVWAVCANPDCQREGGRGRWVMFCACTEMCFLCACQSEDKRKKLSDARKGKNNPMYGKTGEDTGNWKGGITHENKKFRDSFEYGNWRISVFERDDYTCQECLERGGDLNAHHIPPIRDWREPRFSLNIKNGITLCEECHNKTKGNEYEFFNKYFDIANGVGKYKK